MPPELPHGCAGPYLLQSRLPSRASFCAEPLTYEMSPFRLAASVAQAAGVRRKAAETEVLKANREVCPVTFFCPLSSSLKELGAARDLLSKAAAWPYTCVRGP